MVGTIALKERMLDRTKYSTIKEKQDPYEGKWGPSRDRIDHDRLYKEIFETFFAEFIELFFSRSIFSDRL